MAAYRTCHSFIFRSRQNDAPSECDDNFHRELDPSRWMRDASDVRIEKALETHYQDPFYLHTVPDNLVKVVTGQVASKEVEESIGFMINLGTEKAKDLAKRCLGEKGTFWASQQKVRIKDFF